MGTRSAKKGQSDSPAHPMNGNGNGNGNGGATRKGPDPMWEGPIHFVMRSAEATMPLRAEQPVDVEKIEISKGPASAV